MKTEGGYTIEAAGERASCDNKYLSVEQDCSSYSIKWTEKAEELSTWQIKDIGN